jgi:hypothetical protein
MGPIHGINSIMERGDGLMIKRRANSIWARHRVAYTHTQYTPAHASASKQRRGGLCRFLTSELPSASRRARRAARKEDAAKEEEKQQEQGV